MGVIQRTTVELTNATGGAGVATVSGITDDPVSGFIRAIYLEYIGSPPSTADVFIRESANTAQPMPVLTLSDTNTDGWRYPMAQAVSIDEGNIISNQGMLVAVDDYLAVTLSQVNDGDGLTITIVWDGQ